MPPGPGSVRRSTADRPACAVRPGVLIAAVAAALLALPWPPSPQLSWRPGPLPFPASMADLRTSIRVTSSRLSSSRASSRSTASIRAYRVSSGPAEHLSLISARACTPAPISPTSTGGSGSGSPGKRPSRRSQFWLSLTASALIWSSLTACISSCNRVGPISGSSRSRSRKSRQRTSNSICEPMSSSTSTLGGRPASTGCSDRIRCAKECSVPTAAPSSWCKAASARSSPRSLRVSVLFRRLRIRSLSSAAAFSVKVMAAMFSMAIPEPMRATTRSTRALVLPEPAPASTKRVLSRSDPIRLRAAWSPS